MDPMEEAILLEEAIREARSGPIAPEHDVDDVDEWSGSVQYAHDGSHSIECYCTGCMM